ncbi:MAG: hypothetical protein JXA14_26255 [Anaerolineae bacterium]|nr:hypothetical protein [Anaerolineae bacterium]
MESLSSLMRKSKVLQSYDIRELLAEDWGKALRELTGAGLESKAAQELLDSALEREQLAGYPPESDERLRRARATIDTVVALYTHPEMVDRPHEIILNASIAQIDVDPDVQIRVRGIDRERVEDYARDMAEGDEFPPIICFFERLPSGNGHKLWLADGFHRLAAAQSSALAVSIQARVAPGSHRDAVEYAATCNARHGLPMTAADKRNAIRRLLHLHPDLASREIARQVGCSHSTVETVRAEIAASGQIGQIEGKPAPRTVTRAGSTYTYNPPAQPEYADIFQIENCLANYLDVRFGRKGLADFNAQPRIDCLQSIIQFDCNQLPNNLHLPDHYRKRDLKQAVHNVLEQVKARERQRLAGGGDDGKAVTWSPSTPVTQTGDDVRGEPFYSALITGGTSISLISALENCSLDRIDASRALERALVNIFGGNNPARRARASRVILDLIQDAIEGLQQEIDEDIALEEAQAALPAGDGVPDAVGCPECGGYLLRVSMNGGSIRLVCQDCGCVAEPEIAEAEA